MSGDRLDLLVRNQELEEENRKLKERATPKKVKDIYKNNKKEIMIGNCPNCNKIIYPIFHDKFCGHCGQVLDWSMKDEQTI